MTIIATKNKRNAKLSTNAKPKVVQLNKTSSKSGAQEIPLIKEAKIKPVAIAQPIKGINTKLRDNTLEALMNNKTR